MVPKILIVYDSLTGNTEKVAKLIAEGVKEAGGEVQVKKVGNVNLQDLIDADGIILGSPTHYGTMSADMKHFIYETDKVLGKLAGKLGAAFTSSCGDGDDTTLTSLIQAMLIHGMLVIGGPKARYCYTYGISVIGEPTKEDAKMCRALGRRVVESLKIKC
jgi:NAD(P)H dehydrogenase (quinone)